MDPHEIVDLSFIFSFRNESKNIPTLLRRCAKVADSMGIRYEFVFVNDASTDNSLDLLRGFQTEFPIRIIDMARRFGVTPCIIAGLTHSCGRAAVYMDADLQDPPEVVEEMYQKFLSGADVVHATRTERDGETKFKILLTALAYRIINFFSEIELPVDTGDFKLLSRRAIEEILKVKEYDPYMRGLAVWVGLNQNFVLYKREARHSGTSQWPLLSKGPITEFVRGLTAYSAAPLYFAFVVGLFMNLLAVALIGYAIITKIAGISAQGASGTIIVVSLFCGTILMTNGIIGVYLAKIYYQVKGRPPFIVKQVIENQLVSSPLKSS